MRYLLALCVFALSGATYAWDTIGEMEAEICVALTNDNHLLSQEFTNKLNVALSSASCEMRCEAYMLLSMNAYQNFLETADDSWLGIEMYNASNAVAVAGTSPDTWRYWTSRFLYAGAYASADEYVVSLSVASNAVSQLASIPYTNGQVLVERAILAKHDMPDVGICEAMKIMAGMSAASLGMGGVATNFASQVSQQYRDIIYEFIMNNRPR